MYNKILGTLCFCLAFYFYACSDAAWNGEGYGPIYSVLVGGAYGYTEQSTFIQARRHA